MVSPLQETFNRYLAYLKAEKNASAYTVRNYRTDLLDFNDFLVKSKVTRLDAITRQTMRAYLSSLVERGFVKGSIARKQSAIRSWYRYLLREGVIKESPIPVSRKMGRRLESFSVKLDKRLPSFITKEDAERLVGGARPKSPGELRDRAMLELLYAAGLRVSEITRLDVRDIDLSGHQVTVFGKGSKERMALFGEPAANAIKDYLDAGRPALLAGKIPAALFVTSRGNRVGVRAVQKMLEKQSLRLGKRVHPHMLRHTFATHMLDGGADLKVVQELLGHARLTSTQIYSHVTRSQARRVYLSAHPLAQKKNDHPESTD